MNVFDFSTASVLAMVLSVFIPLLSSLVGRLQWDSSVLGLITLAISTATGFVAEWANSVDATHYDWKNALGIAIGSYIMAALGRGYIWRNTAIDAKALAVGSKPVDVVSLYDAKHASPEAVKQEGIPGSAGNV